MGSTSSSSSQIMITKHQFSVYLPIVEEKVTLKKINEFNQIINKYGIFLGVCPSRNQDRKAFVHYIIDLNVDYSILSRGAGRPQVASDYTLEEVEKMLQKGMSSEEIADLLHMSLSSFYRRLKKARTEKSIIHSDVIVF